MDLTLPTESTSHHTSTQQGPLNLGLNDGTYMPHSCIQVLQQFAHTTGLRNYSTAENQPLRDVIAEVDRVSPKHVFLHNGSGPILKQVIPALIKQQITSSPMRIFYHLLNKSGCPIITPTLTYGKAPAKAIGLGLTVELIEVKPENQFKLDISELRKRLMKRPGLVYVVNPNNPTGTIMLPRQDVEQLAGEFPDTLFWVDEAYIQYVDSSLNASVSDLVPRFKNLFVSRTFSFAYGLAGARIGYLLGDPDAMEKQSAALTDYRIGTLQEALAIAALKDPNHLSFIRQNTAEARAELTRGLTQFPGVEVFPSMANFLLCRLNSGAKLQNAAKLAEHMGKNGIKIKTISPLGKYRFDEYFRITTGLPHEHARLLSVMGQVLK
jgi:histidinol-phosphate aminotransferase